MAEERRRVLFESNPLKELLNFSDVLRREETYYAISFNAASKAQEVAAAVKKKMAEEGRDLLSLEVFEEPVSFLPFSAITIVVRTPATEAEAAELGAIVTGTVLLFTALMVALGYVLLKSLQTIEKSGSTKYIAAGIVLFGAAALLREVSGFLPERG